MRPSLIDAIFLSEKRKKFLLLLLDGPRNIAEIKSILNVTSSSMLPQIKKLKDLDLVVQQDGVYRLSDIAKVLVEKMKPLVETVEVIEENYDYWLTRDLSSIPPHLLDRIGELGECQLINPDLNHLFEPPQQFSESVSKSKNIMTFASFFHPQCPYNYAKLARRGVEVSLILTKAVFERLKNDYQKELNSLMDSPNANIFICEENVAIGSVSVTDDIMMVSLFTKDGVLDHKKVISYDPGTLKWGNDLVLHHMGMSKSVTDV